MNTVDITIDKNGLRDIIWHSPTGKKILADRGPLDEAHKDIVVDMIPVQTMINILRKANLHVVVINHYEPGG